MDGVVTLFFILMLVIPIGVAFIMCALKVVLPVLFLLISIPIAAVLRLYLFITGKDNGKQ